MYRTVWPIVNLCDFNTLDSMMRDRFAPRLRQGGFISDRSPEFSFTSNYNTS